MLTHSDLYTFLRQSRLAVLSSTGAAGTPQSALIGFAATPNLEIVFDTVKNSRKYPNLIGSPACSLVVGWSGEKTLQYEGRAQELAGHDLQNYQETYFSTWPECRVHLTWPDIVYFVVRPTWIRYSDYDVNPPLIEEFTLGGSSGLLS